MKACECYLCTSLLNSLTPHSPKSSDSLSDRLNRSPRQPHCGHKSIQEVAGEQNLCSWVLINAGSFYPLYFQFTWLKEKGKIHFCHTCISSLSPALMPKDSVFSAQPSSLFPGVRQIVTPFPQYHQASFSPCLIRLHRDF